MMDFHIFTISQICNYCLKIVVVFNNLVKFTINMQNDRMTANFNPCNNVIFLLYILIQIF